MKAHRVVVVGFCVLALNPSLRAKRTRQIENVIAVPMDQDAKHELVGVGCQINTGGRRYRCVLDSGATHTLISDRVLKAEGPLMELTTANGVIHVHERAVSLTIADGLRVKSNAFVQSNMTLEDVDILVGQDVLRQFRFVTFDYEKQQVEFHR